MQVIDFGAWTPYLEQELLTREKGVQGIICSGSGRRGPPERSIRRRSARFSP